MKKIDVRLFLALPALLLLGACASYPDVSEANARSVVIELDDPDDVDGALKSADAHCAKYGLHAQFKGRLTEERLSYDCVP
jgi:hypothetical protein